MKKENITTSYMEFYNRCASGEFNGWSLEGLKQEFLSSVKRSDFRIAELGEILSWMVQKVQKSRC